MSDENMTSINMMEKLCLPSLDEVNQASVRMAPYIKRSPLVKLDIENLDREIYLKLENLQPTGAFKIRPAYNSILALTKAQKAKGVCTISSGNMALGLALAANQLSVPMAAYLYKSAPKIKIEGIRRLGGEVRFLSKERWFRCVHFEEPLNTLETMIHPVINNEVLAANGTIGLEMVEDLPDLDAVIIPFGGGASTIGIGSVIKKLKPQAKVVAVEGEHAFPLSMSMAAGKPVKTLMRPSFVKSIGSVSVFDEIFQFSKHIVDDVQVVSTASIEDAIRIISSRNKVIAEGAGAASVSAALQDPSLKGKKIVCLISGGNIDISEYVKILQGEPA